METTEWARIGKNQEHRMGCESLVGKVLATKPDNLSSLGVTWVRANRFPQVVLGLLHTFIYTHTHTGIKNKSTQR